MLHFTEARKMAENNHLVCSAPLNLSRDRFQGYELPGGVFKYKQQVWK